MRNKIELPNQIADLYNLCTLEALKRLTDDGLRVEINNGRINCAYIIPDNVSQYIDTDSITVKNTINGIWGFSND